MLSLLLHSFVSRTIDAYPSSFFFIETEATAQDDDNNKQDYLYFFSPSPFQDAFVRRRRWEST